MTTFGEDIVALQKRLADAQRARARAEGAREAAQQAYDRARTDLLDRFGCADIAQAEQLLASLRADIDTLTATLTETLDRIEAG